MYLLFRPNLTCSLQEYSDTGPAPTLQDKAIDSFGVSIGLVRFFGIRSRCDFTTSNATNASEHTPEDDAGDEDSDDETDTDNSNEDYSTLADPFQPITITKGKPVLESHPYIVTQWVASSGYRLIFISYTCIYIALLSVPWT
jgi:hypothetical protein